MAYAMAIAMSHKVVSRTDTNQFIVFAPLSKLLQYVDESYNKALQVRNGALAWYRAKDQMTRGMWNEFLMKGWSLGEAMDEVKSVVRNDWKDFRGHGDVPNGDWDGAYVDTYASSSWDTASPAPRKQTFFQKTQLSRQQRRQQAVNRAWLTGNQPPAKGGRGKGGKGKGKPVKGKGGKGKGKSLKGYPSGTFCQQDGDGHWFCVKWGAGGCTEPCPEGKLHKCSVRIGYKQACKGTHRACEHLANPAAFGF